MAYFTLSGNEKHVKANNFVFCSEEPKGYMDYSQKEENIYQTGEKVWMYTNVKNAKFQTDRTQAGKVRIWISYNLKLLNQNGKTIKKFERSNPPSEIEKEKLDNLWLGVPIDTEDVENGLPSGTYQVSLEIKDEYSGTTDKMTGTFRLQE